MTLETRLEHGRRDETWNAHLPPRLNLSRLRGNGLASLRSRRLTGRSSGRGCIGLDHGARPTTTTRPDRERFPVRRFGRLCGRGFGLGFGHGSGSFGHLVDHRRLRRYGPHRSRDEGWQFRGNRRGLGQGRFGGCGRRRLIAWLRVAGFAIAGLVALASLVLTIAWDPRPTRVALVAIPTLATVPVGAGPLAVRPLIAILALVGTILTLIGTVLALILSLLAILALIRAVFAILSLVAILSLLAVLPLIRAVLPLIAIGTLCTIARLALGTIVALGAVALGLALAFAIEATALRIRLRAGPGSCGVAVAVAGGSGSGRRALLLGCETLARQGETIGHHEIVVIALVGVHLAGLALVARLGLLLRLLGRRDDAEVVFGMLQVVFGSHWVAGGLSVTRELEVLFADMLGRTPDLHIGTIRLI